MFIHPDIHLEIARQRHQDLLANAARRAIAKADDHLTGLVPLARHASDRGHVTRSWAAHGRYEGVLIAADHFGHRETGGIVVDRFWNRRNLKDEFRVEVEDEREGARFVLHATTGREAIRAFYRPFSATELRRRSGMGA
jgi:hypothetical protein